MKYKTVTCGKCLDKNVVYSDIHEKTWRCPKCSTVHGVMYKDCENYEYPDCRVEPYLVGEDSYDWDWLDYDKPKGGDAVESV